MISIRKQFFSIFLTIGLVMVLATSTIVNISIKRNFEMYIDTTIKQAGDIIVNILGENYIDGRWKDDTIIEMVFKNYMGNFGVALLDENRNYICGVTKEDLIKRVEADVNVSRHPEELKYRTEERTIYDNSGKIVGYAVISFSPSNTLSDNDKRFQRNVNMSIIWCCSIILMWFTIAGLYVSRLFTYHIYGITKTSIALAEGKLNARYPLRSKIKEIETLRHSMNYLGERLEKQDKIRKKLISDVSHEIRTPLHILQSNLEAMIDGIYPINDEQMEMLYKEVVRFGKLLNNLDLLKNVEESEFKMDKKRLRLNESIQEVFDSFKIIAKEKRITYHFKGAETENIMILGDKDALKQLWMNTLSNAFKFTGDKGDIRVTTSALDNKECKVIIEDTGIGISEEDLPYVFERMYRADKSREKYEGSGIGLTMVKNIVEQHGGKVSIESEENKFTRIIIVLPIDTVMLEPNNITSKMKSYMKIGK